MDLFVEIPIKRTWCEYLNPCPHGELEASDSVKMVGSYECVEECPFCVGRTHYPHAIEVGILCSNPKNQ